jgi:hypothetical protein
VCRCGALCYLAVLQATDNAHVANERIRVSNLIVGVQVLRSFFCEIGKVASPAVPVGASAGGAAASAGAATPAPPTPSQ